MTVSLTLPCFSPPCSSPLPVQRPPHPPPRLATQRGPGPAGRCAGRCPCPNRNGPGGRREGSRRAVLAPPCLRAALSLREKAQPQQISPGQRPLSCSVPGLRGPVPSGVAFPTAATVDAPLVDFEIQFLPSPGRASSTVTSQVPGNHPRNSPRCRRRAHPDLSEQGEETRGWCPHAEARAGESVPPRLGRHPVRSQGQMCADSLQRKALTRPIPSVLTRPPTSLPCAGCRDKGLLAFPIPSLSVGDARRSNERTFCEALGSFLTARTAQAPGVTALSDNCQLRNSSREKKLKIT